MLREFPTRDQAVLAEILDRQSRERPDAVYAKFPDEQWTFAQTARKAWQLGHGLLREGVAAGESVSVWMPTRPELLQTWFGINAAGAVYAPLNLAARGMFLQHALNVAQPRIIIAHGGLVDRLAGLDVPTLETVVVVGDAPEVELPWRVIAFDDLLEDVPDTRPELAVATEPWDDFALVYTSGTTGPSKGVRLPYASIRLYGENLVWPETQSEDTFLMVLPLSHVAGTSTVFAMLQRGGAVALPGAFSAKSFWAEVRRYGATATFIIHAMILFLLNEPERPDDADNSIRYAYMGPLTRVDEFSKRFGIDVYTGFGMTEVPLCMRSELNPTQPSQCGRQFHPDYELRLVDEHDIEVPVGEPGELIIRHRHPWHINAGYKGMGDATAEAWRNGWFHTGDQMRLEPDGYYVFLDRVKDSIRRRGENISSWEVEAEVLAFPGVAECAAVAVSNPDVDESTHDEEVKIVVVPVEGQTVEPLALTEFLIPRMPRHMVPRYVEVLQALPKSPSFKVQKNVLRDAGITDATWDREAAGIKLKREQLV